MTDDEIIETTVDLFCEKLKTLLKNNGKGIIWKADLPITLFSLLTEQVYALQEGISFKDLNQISKECLDIAAYAIFIDDVK